MTALRPTTSTTAVETAPAASPTPAVVAPAKASAATPLKPGDEFLGGVMGNKIVFEVQVPNTLSWGEGTKAHKVLAGEQLKVAESNSNTPPVPPEAIASLRSAFKKDAAGKDVVSNEKLTEAKAALLLYWGFPAAFVAEYASELKFNQIGDSGSAVRADGWVLGSFGDGTFNGYIDSNADWPKSEIEEAMARVLPPPAPDALTLTDDFFKRNGIADDKREAVSKRLLGVLKAWLTADDGEFAWAKEVLRVGFDTPDNFKLTANKTSGCAVGPDQTVKGVYVTPANDQEHHFQLSLDTGILLDMGGSWHLYRGEPSKS